MKRIIALAIGVISLIFLASCTNSGNEIDYYTSSNNFESSNTTIESTPSHSPPSEPSSYRTIEELGRTIVAAGTFWEHWWDLSGKFAHEHIVFDEWDENPEHLRGIYHRLLPSSGLESLDSVHSYLSQYYTQEWIVRELSSDFAPFVEYNGELYIHTARASFPSPRWETATHILVEQDSNHAIVETTVSVAIWYAYTVEPWEVIWPFTIIGGRIDDGPGPWELTE